MISLNLRTRSLSLLQFGLYFLLQELKLLLRLIHEDLALLLVRFRSFRIVGQLHIKRFLFEYSTPRRCHTHLKTSPQNWFICILNIQLLSIQLDMLKRVVELFRFWYRFSFNFWYSLWYSFWYSFYSLWHNLWCNF